MTPNEWIIGDDTGVSSKTIWAVMTKSTNAKMPFGCDIPHDPSDFGRCYRLLEHFPEWKKRLNEIPKFFPKWGPMIREWDKMTELWEKESQFDRCPELFAFMQTLNDECMAAAGYTKTNYGWKKDH